ncbi:MAG: hypothetical protein OEU46_13570, partial [Alphaproteobacteria bacterium]|nr:hypothetical protein [Alphaproteobacteria bacterium]
MDRFTIFSKRKAKIGFLVSALLISFHVSIAQAASPQDYCAYGERAVLILIDRTTAYDDRDRKIFASGFERIIEALQLGDKVLVQTIADDYAKSETVFQQCLPGCPDAGFSGWLTAQCRSLQARADLTHFKRTLAGSIRQLLKNRQDYEQSDIVRTIARTTDALRNLPFEKNQNRKLALVVLFSDLIENSALLPWPAIVNKKRKAMLAHLKDQGIEPAV